MRIIFTFAMILWIVLVVVLLLALCFPQDLEQAAAMNIARHAEAGTTPAVATAAAYQWRLFEMLLADSVLMAVITYFSSQSKRRASDQVS